MKFKLYNVGDRIVYPMHGAGIISAIEEREILGEKKSYYILTVPIGTINLMVPINNALEIGVRNLVSNEVIDELIENLRKCEVNMNENWNKRYRENMEIIKSGEIFGISVIYKYLILREKHKGLSTGEKKMFVAAKQILASEVILVKDIDQDEAEKLLENAIFDDHISIV